jgi:recombination protein RecR
MNELKFLEPLIISFEKLPGVGQKTATRYAFQVVEKLTEEDVEEFAKVLVEVKKNIKHCEKCNILTTSDLCDICENELRDQDKILVVKDTKDVISLEKTKQYNGLYHVLGGVISPMDGVGPSDIEIDSLTARILPENIREVILALPTTMEGDTTNFYIYKRLQNLNHTTPLKISQIARGVAIGNELEYTDEITLGRSIVNRIEFKM